MNPGELLWHADRGNEPRYEATDVALSSAASTCLALLSGLPWFQVLLTTAIKNRS